MSRSRRAPFGLHRYAPVLRVRGSRSLLLATLVGRTGMFGVGLALLLAVHAQTGSFGIAGTASGLFMVGTALSRIPQGRVADRCGTRPVLLGAGALFTLLGGALVLAVALGAGSLALFALACLAGVSTPATNSITRALWADLIPVTDERVSAYALDALAMELASMLGPTSAGLLATLVTPTFALGLLAGTLSAGTLAVALSHAAGARAPVPHGDRSLLLRPLATVGAIAFGLGLTAGAIEVAVPAFAAERGSPAAAGPVLACWALGSAIGGLWFGTRVWRARRETMLLGFLASVAAGCALLPLAPSLAVLGGFLVLMGLALSPTLTTIYLLVDDRVAHERLAEATAWVLSALPLGVAGGNVLGGWAVNADGARTGMAVGALLSLVALGVALRAALATRRPRASLA